MCDRCKLAYKPMIPITIIPASWPVYPTPTVTWTPAPTHTGQEIKLDPPLSWCPEHNLHDECNP